MAPARSARSRLAGVRFEAERWEWRSGESDSLGRRDLEAARARKEQVPIGLSLAILEEVLETLEAAHGAGVIHRDVTPRTSFWREAARRRC